MRIAEQLLALVLLEIVDAGPDDAAIGVAEVHAVAVVLLCALA